MFKHRFASKSKKQKILTVLGWAVLMLLLGAVIIGLLNALVADGEWDFGWSSYRYDETGYEMGSSTVFSTSIEALEIDWIEGEVIIEVAADDTFISVTETSEGTLSENEIMRRAVSADGKVLLVKFCKSAAFLGFGGVEEKTLIVRVPARMMGQLNRISVNADEADVQMRGVDCASVFINSTSGDLSLLGNYQALSATTTTGDISVDAAVTGAVTLNTKGGDIKTSHAIAPESMTAITAKGDVEVNLPADIGFTLRLDCDRDALSSDRMLTENGEQYTYGDGKVQISLKSSRGQVRIGTRPTA